MIDEHMHMDYINGIIHGKERTRLATPKFRTDEYILSVLGLSLLTGWIYWVSWYILKLQE